MKTLEKQSELYRNTGVEKLNLGSQIVTEGVKIEDYSMEKEKGQLIISLYSELFLGTIFRIFLRNNKISVIISEVVGPGAFSNGLRYDWQGYYSQSYTRMRNVSLLLPGDNFYLLRHFLIPEKFLLKIILGQITDN